jgi:hypothetical protein
LPTITASPPKRRLARGCVHCQIYVEYKLTVLLWLYAVLQLLISEFLSLKDNDVEGEQNKELILSLYVILCSMLSRTSEMFR